jgi:hypothetical protein
MRYALYIAVLLVAISLGSCKKAMTKTTIEQNLEQFDSIVLNSVFEVHLIQGSSNSIKLEGATKILENIEFSVENNTLTIENNYHGNWMHPKNNKVLVYITVDTLNLITANETCNILSDNQLVTDELGLIMKSKLNNASLNVSCNTFYYWNNFPCGGKVTVKGTCNQVKIWNVALMAVDAKELASQFGYVDNASKGSVFVNCAQKLSYKLTGEGDIHLSGNPPVIEKLEEAGKGKLILE